MPAPSYRTLKELTVTGRGQEPPSLAWLFAKHSSSAKMRLRQSAKTGLMMLPAHRVWHAEGRWPRQCHMRASLWMNCNPRRRSCWSSVSRAQSTWMGCWISSTSTAMGSSTSTWRKESRNGCYLRRLRWPRYCARSKSVTTCNWPPTTFLRLRKSSLLFMASRSSTKRLKNWGKIRRSCWKGSCSVLRLTSGVYPALGNILRENGLRGMAASILRAVSACLRRFMMGSMWLKTIITASQRHRLTTFWRVSRPRKVTSASRHNIAHNAKSQTLLIGRIRTKRRVHVKPKSSTGRIKRKCALKKSLKYSRRLKQAWKWIKKTSSQSALECGGQMKRPSLLLKKPFFQWRRKDQTCSLWK